MEKNMNTNPETGEKTFTQEQVNAIIGERLAKEKNKADAALAEREQQLVKRELLITAKERINEMGLPMELLEALDISSPEALDKAITAAKKAFEQAKKKKEPLRVYEPNILPVGEHYEEDPQRQLRKAMRLPD